jgi:nucleotidyltransferase substrate binding protein (TIGR01987 family)
MVKSPREAIKQAFQAGIIEDGHTWMNAFEDRNLTVHTYDEDTANEILFSIRNSYFPALQQLNVWMQSKI